MTDIDSKAFKYENVRKAVRAFERQAVHAQFAIGDAIIQDIGEPKAVRNLDHERALKECSEYLHDLGYDYAQGTLKVMRTVAHAFKPDHRADILETFPHLSWTVFRLTADDPTILDDCVALLESPDVKFNLRIPDGTALNIRKRRNVTVAHVEEIKAYIKQQNKRAVSEIYGTDDVDPGEILINIETPAMRKAARDRHPSLGAERPPATKSYTNKEFAELRRQADEEALAASETPESVDATEDGFTYVIHAKGEVVELPERKTTIDQLLALLDDAKTSLYEFLRAWATADLRLDDALEVLEALDSVRVAWERSHEMISGYSPEMH